MPLDQLLRLQEEQQQMYRELKQQQLSQQHQQQKNLIYPDNTIPSSSARLPGIDTTASSSHCNNNNNNTIFNPNLSQNSVSPSATLQQHFDTYLQSSAVRHQQQSQQQQLHNQQQDPNSQGHMLLMLSQGRYHYYKNGTRKQKLEWDDDGNGDDTMEDAQMQSFGNQRRVKRLFDHKMVEEGEGDAIMETDNMDEESNKRKYSTMAYRDRKGKGKFRSIARAVTDDRYLPLKDASYVAQPPESLERMPSDDSFSPAPKTKRRPLIFHSGSSPDLDPLLQQHLLPSPRSLKPKTASLGRIRGTKSRASVSYTVLPTMAEPATIAYHPSFTSASMPALFLPSSSSSHMAPHLLRHRGSGSMTSGILTGMATPSSMTSRSPKMRSWADLSHYPGSASMMLLDSLSNPMKVAYMLQPGSQQRRGKADNPDRKKGGRSLSVSILSTALRKPIFGSTDEAQSPPLPRAETDPMNHKDDEEADKEMEQAQADICVSPTNKVKKRFRAMSMVELSATSPLQLKAEPSTSTSTMVTLHSEGRYQWSQFFDV